MCGTRPELASGGSDEIVISFQVVVVVVKVVAVMMCGCGVSVCVGVVWGCKSLDKNCQGWFASYKKYVFVQTLCVVQLGGLAHLFLR